MGGKKRRASRERLTELEGCVLGLVWEKGPCSAYVVRKEFLDSESSYWSGSAGAIYPVLGRLESLGLVRAVEHPWGTRKRREFSVTKEGRQALIHWIGPPLEPWTAAPTFDPVRTRMYFIEAIPSARRLRLIEAAIENLRRQLDALRAAQKELDRTPTTPRALAGLGTICEVEGRLRWLAAVRDRIFRERASSRGTKREV